MSGNYYRVFDNESFVKDSFSAWCDIYCFDCQGFVFGVAIGVLPEIKLKKMTVVKRFNHPFAAFDDFFQSGVDKFFISDQKAKTPSVNVKESDAGFDLIVQNKQQLLQVYAADLNRRKHSERHTHGDQDARGTMAGHKVEVQAPT